MLSSSEQVAGSRSGMFYMSKTFMREALQRNADKTYYLLSPISYLHREEHL